MTPNQYDPATSANPKPGWATTEFYLTLASYVLPLLTMIFHNDFSGYAQDGALAAAGVATLGYNISRALTKKNHATARAQILATNPARANSVA